MGDIPVFISGSGWQMLMKYQRYKEIEMNIDFLSYFDSFVLKEALFCTKHMVKSRVLPIKWVPEGTDILWLKWLVALILTFPATLV